MAKAKTVHHVFAISRNIGAAWWHETAHADLADAQGDAEELREGWQNARTRILVGPDESGWGIAKLRDLNNSQTTGRALSE